MANDKYTKRKNLEVSGRSWFGRPSQMDKEIAKWTNLGWELNKKTKIRLKNRYKLEFVYRMSEEEISRKKKADRNIAIVVALVFLFACGYITLQSQIKNAQEQQSIEATQRAHNATAQVFLEASQTMSVIETATATLWTPTNTYTPSKTPTITDTAVPTNTATITNTPQPSTTTYYINKSSVNSRECPQTTCARVAPFSFGESIQVIKVVSGETVSGIDKWYEVAYQDKVIYIHSSLATSTKPATPRPNNGGNNITSSGSSNQPQASTAIPQPQWSCVGDIYNCGDFSSCSEVMPYFNACPGDPSGLDGNNNGVPCESLCG